MFIVLRGTTFICTVWQRLFMREWKALNVRGCGSGSKSKICESEFNVQCLWGSLWLQPEAIPYILSKLTTELYPGILSLTHTVRKQIWLTCCYCWFVPPYVSMFSPDVCHQNCLRSCTEKKWRWTEFYPPVKKDQEIGTRHFTPFKRTPEKWRENRENLVSNLESRWSVLVEGRALWMLL